MIILHRRPHFLGDISEITQGEETFAASTNLLNVAIPATTLDKTLLIFTYNDTSSDSGGQENENRIRGQLSSTTNIQFQTQTTTTTSKTIKWYLIHYSSISLGIIHRGSHSMSGVSDNITIPAVTLANAFPVNSLENNAGNLNSATMVKYDLTTTTNMAITSGVDRNQVIDWQVVDHPDYDVTKVTVTIADTATEGNTTISAVDQSKVWLTGGYEYDVSFIQGNDVATWFMSSDTNVRLRRSSTSDVCTAVIYVVDGNGKFVIKQIVTNNIPNASSSKDVTISPSAWTPHTVVFFMGIGNGLCEQTTGAAHSGNDDLQLKFNMSSTTNLRAERVGTSETSRFAVQVLDFTPSIES